MKAMFCPGAIFLLLLLACSSITLPAQTTTEQIAQQSAEAWLARVDAGEYAESWQQASSTFKAHVTKDQWVKLIGATLGPLGKNTSRKLKSATYTTTLPGAPDGRYVVIQYESSFEHKQSAIETITPMLDSDGLWRVSGYFIK
jgi:Protein of unknown function (DUF4019)